MKYYPQLKSIIAAADWTQEQAALNLGVSFATLNSWINKRSTPRRKMQLKIDQLYLDIVGAEEIDETVLLNTKQTALKLRITPKKIVSNQQALDKLILYLTYHTNTIEGSTMTLSDVEEVIFDNKVLSNRTAIEQAEARNHQATLYWLIDELVEKGKDFVVTETLILGIHLRLMNGIIGDAGQYRKHAVRIMGSHVALANWANVPKLVNKLTTDLKRPSGNAIDLIANTHARFEQIHPFSDGNGRTGRLIMLAQALKYGLVPPLVLKERKHAYYKYLELAQTKDDHKPLELLVAESMMFTDALLEPKSSPELVPTPHLKKSIKRAETDFATGKNIKRTKNKGELKGYLDSL